MTTLQSAVEAIRQALEKATPGPWKPELEETYNVRGPDGGQVALCTNLKGRLGLGGRRSGDEVSANTRLIAASNPAALRLILDALAAGVAREHIARQSEIDAHDRRLAAEERIRDLLGSLTVEKKQRKDAEDLREEYAEQLAKARELLREAWGAMAYTDSTAELHDRIDAFLSQQQGEKSNG